MNALEKIAYILRWARLSHSEYDILFNIVNTAMVRDEAQDTVDRLRDEANRRKREEALTAGLNDHERTLTANGKYIEAIRSYRARAECGLKAAKDVVDAYRTTLNLKPQD